MKPEIGTVTVIRHLVVWTLQPGEARELTDFMEESVTGDDLAHKDVAALREAADLADGGER